MMTQLRSNKEHNYSVLDIEAEKWINFKMMGFYDGKDFTVFRSVQDFLEYFLQRRYAFWRCFAHFGGGYDFNFILETLTENFDFSYEILSNNGASMIKVKDKGSSKGRCWYFLDSYRLLPSSLAKLTESFDTEHKKLKINFEEDLDKAEAITYLEHDCKGLYEVLQKFSAWFDTYKTPLMPTTASQAMALYRRMMPREIPTLKPDIEEFIRQGYHGGRTEVFKMRCDKKFNYYDVCSLYPYVMKNFSMPIGSPIKVYSLRENNIGFYKADITVPDMYFPPLPVVHQKKLMFPVGKFSGYYSSAELNKAIELGCDVDVHEGYIFPDEFIFDEYIDMMFEKKSTGQGATKAIAKLMLTSLYGKFGQKREKTSIFRPLSIRESVGCSIYNEKLGLYQRTKISKACFIIPSIASWVTSNARMVLLDWLIKSGEQKTYYCDTDSIVSTSTLPIGSKLGDLKLEHLGNKAVFLSPKTYAMDTEEGLVKRAKGFEYELIDKLSFEDYERALLGNNAAFVQDVQRVAKFKEALRREGKFLTMLSKKKTIRSGYDKRVLVEDYDTIPQRMRQIVDDVTTIPLKVSL